MNKTIQSQILAYFLRHKSPLVDKFKVNWFSILENQEIFKLIQKYYRDYTKCPSIDIFLDFMQKHTDKNYTVIIESLYELVIEQEYIEDKIVFEAQKALYKNLMDENYDSLQTADDAKLKLILKQFSDVYSLSAAKDTIKSINPFEKKFVQEQKQIWPTWIPSWNAMMSKGGFASPELIVLLSGPKMFKTGFGINLAVNFVLNGAKLVFVDWENGETQIGTRLQQALFQLSYSEYISDEFDDKINSHLKNSKSYFRGGGIRLLSLNANKDSLDVVDNEIARLINEEDFNPDMIIYDYLDLAACADDKIRETRFQIRHIYHHAISINKKYDCFSITPSQANRASIGKPTFTISDFAEDFGKVMNAHASFALCRSKEELLQHRARLCVVFQRQGIPPDSPGSVCNIEIKEDIMVVNPIEDDFEDLLEDNLLE